ncbi:hypothetical protein PG988_005716 [Apiospora saccharicola]
MADDKDGFTATHVFTHPYADCEVLEKYLKDKLELKESQFETRVITTELRLQLKDTDKTIDQKTREEIEKRFTEAKRKRKLEAAKSLLGEE